MEYAKNKTQIFYKKYVFLKTESHLENESNTTVRGNSDFIFEFHTKKTYLNS